jgi:hypothetical protein
MTHTAKYREDIKAKNIKELMQDELHMRTKGEIARLIAKAITVQLNEAQEKETKPPPPHQSRNQSSL